MQKALVFLIAFLVTPSFSGCLEAEDKRTIIEEPGIFDFGRPQPITTWYHYAGGIMHLMLMQLNKQILLLIYQAIISLISQMQHTMELGMTPSSQP